MDRRSWPWKRKSSKEATSEQNNSKNVVSYIQLPQERYAHLSQMEDQVKVLNGKLSDAQSELTTKEDLVKQHTKVAEEAISGWEKAEAEALSLKTELESVTQLKLAAEDKALNLDGSLKECMKQIIIVKEEGEQKLNDVVSEKTEQWEKAQSEFERNIYTFEQELQKLSAENDVLSRSLQEHSEMLMKVNEGKYQADAQIEALKVDIQSYVKEINSLRYELHVVSKELEIRNEEKNMCVRSAEVANKQHLEDIKKITKLEAECQKLRGLVRKKLPGPAAVAQMKQEVERFGGDFMEERFGRSPNKCYSPRSGSASDFVLGYAQQLRKENELLTARLVATEEESKILKEALSNRNPEFQAKQDIFSKTSSNLQNEGAQNSAMKQPIHLSSTNIYASSETSTCKNRGKSPRSMSMSDDCVDVGSCESWGTASVLESSYPEKENVAQNVIKMEKPNQLELMDDFLEMEKLACLSTEHNGSNCSLDNSANWNAVGNSSSFRSVDDMTEVKSQKAHQPGSPTSDMQEFAAKTLPVKEETLLSKLLSEISVIFETQGENANVEKILADIKNILQNLQKDLPQHSIGCTIQEVQPNNAQEKNSPSNHKNSLPNNEDLERAIRQVHDFVVSLGKEVTETRGIESQECGHCQKVDELSTAIDKLLSTEQRGDDFLEAMSSVLLKTKEFWYGIFHEKDLEGDGNNSDCIDKVTLLEKKIVQNGSGKDRYTDSSSDSEVPHEGRSYPSSEKMDARDVSKEFEQVKLENESLLTEIARLNESLEQKTQGLLKVEEQVASLETQLAACQKSSSLSDTQLKCMTESYTSLESRCRHLDDEIKTLREKVDMLDNELQEERRRHEVDLAMYRDLQEQVEREDKNIHLAENEVDRKTKQEKEVAAAAEKLAECQETILLLGRQLKAMNSQADFRRSSANEGDDCIGDVLFETTQDVNGSKMEASSKPQAQNLASILQRPAGGESESDTFSSHSSASDTDAKRPKHRSTWSYSSDTLYASAEKPGRGFSRFFSKGKN